MELKKNKKTILKLVVNTKKYIYLKIGSGHKLAAQKTTTIHIGGFHILTHVEYRKNTFQNRLWAQT